jgi:hypothetical protein
VIQFDLASFAAHVARAMNNNVEEAKKIALEVGAKMIQHEAKRVIGIYLFDWPQLAPSTQAERHACRQSRECSLWGRRLHPRTGLPNGWLDQPAVHLSRILRGVADWRPTVTGAMPAVNHASRGCC